MKKALILSQSLCIVLSASAFSAGVTTHMYIGEKAIEAAGTHDAGLARFLESEWISFRRGTAFPDAAMIRLEKKHVTENVDQLSHDGLKEGKIFDGKGHFMAEFARTINRHCGTQIRGMDKEPMSGSCSAALGYYLGILNHLVADAPWHKEWVARTTAAHCPTMPKKGLSKKGSSNDRHIVADHDLDICLSSRLSGNPLPIEVMTSKHAAVKTGTKVALGCPAGQFPDATLSNCYSCDHGYNHNPLLPVEVNGVCHKPAAHSYLKGTQQSCGQPGGWLSTNNGKCYHCPSGYSHDISKFGDQTGVCYKKTANAHSKKARKEGEFSISCPSGKFPGIACVTPTSHQRKALDDALKSMGLIGDIDRFILKMGCPGGKIPDPEKLFSCYKCPSGLTHYPQYNLTDSRVCHAKAAARCDLIDAEPGIFGARTLFSDLLYTDKAREEMERGPIAFMKEAQAAIGRDELHRKTKKKEVKKFHFDWAEADEEVTEFFSTGRKEPLTILTNNDFHYSGTGLSPHAPECDWMYSKVISGDRKALGNINHSAFIVSHFMRHAWSAFRNGHPPELIRTGNGFGYSLKVNGEIKYKY